MSTPPKDRLGRGGWTWYTGSASWMYRVGLEAILGFTKRGDMLEVRPCVPRSWPGFTIEYRYGGTQYTIQVEQTDAEGDRTDLVLDGRAVTGPGIPLVDDGGRHTVMVKLARAHAD